MEISSTLQATTEIRSGSREKLAKTLPQKRRERKKKFHPKKSLRVTFDVQEYSIMLSRKSELPQAILFVLFRSNRARYGRSYPSVGTWNNKHVDSRYTHTQKEREKYCSLPPSPLFTPGTQRGGSINQRPAHSASAACTYPKHIRSWA